MGNGELAAHAPLSLFTSMGVPNTAKYTSAVVPRTPIEVNRELTDPFYLDGNSRIVV